MSSLVDLALLSGGQLHAQFRPVDLLDAVCTSIAAERSAAHRKEIALRAELPARLGVVHGDEARLRQVFASILSNATKFTPPGGRIDVRATTNAGRAVIAVSDSGEGIAEDKLDDVFETFRRGRAGGAKNRGGLGIGLTIAKHLVELHGGTIRASSEGQGHGACFEVELPLVHVQELESNGHPSRAMHSASHPQKSL
ncbi:MAG: sensor histidine kinase [Polyangiales bacterium]